MAKVGFVLKKSTCVDWRKTMGGKFDEMKGRVKKATGELTGNRKLKQEGDIDKAAGKVKQGVDKVKRTLQGKK
jgi:uncharacterized protein YjbJ (UPF0337 family)